MPPQVPQYVVDAGFKYRFYPTEEQSDYLARTFGCVRVVYNRALDARKKHYAETGKGLRYGKTSVLLTGVISVTANVAPREMHDMVDLAKKGDREAAGKIDKALTGLHEHLFIESNPIPVKWALHKMGLIQEGIRLPLTWLTESSKDTLTNAMKQAYII